MFTPVTPYSKPVGQGLTHKEEGAAKQPPPLFTRGWYRLYFSFLEIVQPEGGLAASPPSTFTYTVRRRGYLLPVSFSFRSWSYQIHFGKFQ